MNHFAEAEQLLARSSEYAIDSVFHQRLIDRAGVHAQLALVQEPEDAEVLTGRPTTFLIIAVDGAGTCAACGREMAAGAEIYSQVIERRPWLQEDDETQEYDVIEWHRACDRETLSAAFAEDHRPNVRSGTVRVKTLETTGDRL